MLTISLHCFLCCFFFSLLSFPFLFFSFSLSLLLSFLFILESGGRHSLTEFKAHWFATLVDKASPGFLQSLPSSPSLVLGLHAFTSTSSFNIGVGIWTQVLKYVEQALYPWSHLFSLWAEVFEGPFFFFKQWSFSLGRKAFTFTKSSQGGTSEMTVQVKELVEQSWWPANSCQWENPHSKVVLWFWYMDHRTLSMCMFVCRCMCVCHREEGVRFPGAGGTGGYELPSNMDARN